MKRWYILPRSIYEEEHPTIGMPRCALTVEDSYVELDDAHILLCADFAKDKHEAMWNDHPEIARLAHPQLEQEVPLQQLHAHPRHSHKQFKPHHFDKLKQLCAQHGHQLAPTHTLWDAHDALARHYPGLTLTRY